MARRATGANAVMRLAFESVYGVPESGGYYLAPFVSSNLGEEQGLVASDLLGQGREPQEPSLDVANNVGDVVVPVDARYFPMWLKLMMGAPVTTGSVAATGMMAFASQPAAGSKITLNGTDWTFVASGATGNQTNIGANVGATVAQLRTDLNASADTQVALCTYAGTGSTLLITKDLAGVDGNAYTIAADAGVHASLSGATLSGGLNLHTFTSGADALPSMDIEIGHPDLATPKYGMNFGGRGNTAKVGMARSGLLNATINVIAQGEDINDDSADDTPTELPVTRFSQFKGSVKKDGAVLADVVSADWTINNNLDPVEVIRDDGRIEDADPGTFGFDASIVTRFPDTVLLDQATSQTPCEISFGHTMPNGMSILVTAHRVFLPKPKRPITGPKGIQLTFAAQAAKDLITGHAVTVEVVNDVASYA